MAQTKADPWAKAKAVTLLKDAHEALTHLMPAPGASREMWRDFYLRSAEVYAHVAEVDRGHHHEALYWAKREREKGEALRSVNGGEVADDQR
ncbi:AMED_5909 family protein [Saccharothrix hoggarensis]|uniref:AMED_5909 family protein n=1 Tax=Saccharothrix hoggarensis TaxID=913853 RepID=A0ABW3QI09_9PSEU